MKMPIKRDGLEFWSLEAAYMAAKTNDMKLKEKISKLSPGEAKRFGKSIPLREDWEEVKLQIMKELLLDKFSQPLFQALFY